MRICVIGDELVAGVGDPRGLGWVGRVIARTAFVAPPLVMTLAMPGETTAALASRWEGEVKPRLSREEPNRLVIGVGAADASSGLSTARSRLNLANIVDQAMHMNMNPLVVGPPPLTGADRQQLKRLSDACQEVCQRRGLPFVDVLTPLSGHAEWDEDMVTSNAQTMAGALLPGQAGFGMMAWVVLHSGWYQWVGAGPRQ